MEGICELVVEAEARILDEASEGRRPCLGRSEAGMGGGCEDWDEGVVGRVDRDGVAARS